ncbi:alpha/beta hydrolase family protein [Flindersiella endophytica]
MKRLSTFRPRRGMALVTFAVLALVIGLVPGASATVTGARSSAILPVRQCADLVRTFDIPGAATRVTSATVVPAGAEPAHCDVRGVIEPAVGFQLRLPTETYQGRYLQYGCGGFCGMFFPAPFADCGIPNGGDVAVAVTDDGHTSDNPFPPVDASWAADNQAARNDWQFRAPHVLSKAAKRIIATYYGAQPRTSYFSGCSNGGREGLLLAQRYPHDFDGIIAGAPGAFIYPLAVSLAWNVRSNTAADGDPILTIAKLPVLHAAVMAACDGLDGLVDNQLEDPRSCRFDPASIRCPAGTDQPSCLTAAQTVAVRKLYAGPADPAGRRLYPGGQAYGSELAWAGWVIPDPVLGAFGAELADNALRYIGYPIGTPHSSLADFEFTAREFHRLTPEGVRANSLSLDLREFRRAGGKLVIWHGWADSAIPPEGTLDYYQRLADRNGGLRATQQWARTFMVPSVYHCGDGSGLTEFDPFPELVAWVERGTAPARVVARGRDASGAVVRTRPVFPYPLRAAYDGSGSTDDAANFVPERPSGAVHDRIRWVGDYLYALPGPVAR